MKEKHKVMCGSFKTTLKTESILVLKKRLLMRPRFWEVFWELAATDAHQRFLRLEKNYSDLLITQWRFQSSMNNCNKRKMSTEIQSAIY